MSEELVKIEVNGALLEARKGAMLIEVTDQAGIAVPRFCYHHKLSVAANCRMCLVEVEKAPKPLPACATPVMDGMKVYTNSAKAIAAQRGVMEFLLINHPLDCPICDQGGECELQDLSMGYGSSISRFAERKRVVKDKDIGPLIATEMTRCIHCTRCVRFGEEIAGLRELGATGRGEHMEIGTYVERTVTSELSGNVIDLCPVGALTAKPSRFSGRSWEYVQHTGIAPHDCVGSNIYLHSLRGKVMRVVPRENEAVNEVWISDRDRFSYEGVHGADRALQPLVRRNDSLEEVEWEAALAAARDGLRAIIDRHGADAIGVLVSPTATLEEMYLVQKLARGLGIANIDHRLRQGDFSGDDDAPVYPWLGQPLAEIEHLDAALLVGSNVRMDQPLVGHRLRKAALAGAKLMFINPRGFDFRFPVAAQIVADPVAMVSSLAAVAKVVADVVGVSIPSTLENLIEPAVAGNAEHAIAQHLVDSPSASVFLGNLATAHPAFAQMKALAVFVARTSNASLGYLPDAANSVGGCLAGVLPRRGPAGASCDKFGLDARAMVDAPRKAYVLVGVEPEFDCWDAGRALAAVQQAELVISIAPFVSEATQGYVQVLLPAAAFGETAGTYVNVEGRWQSFQGAVKPLAGARPAWKILRVLGNLFELEGFGYLSADDVLAEVQAVCQGVEPLNLVDGTARFEPYTSDGLMRVAEVPIYATDALVRRAQGLQATPLASQGALRLHPDVARELGLAEASEARVRQNGATVTLPLTLDDSIARGCAWIPAALSVTAVLGAAMGTVEIRSV